MKKVKKIIILILISVCFIIPFLWSYFEFMALKPASSGNIPPVPNDSQWIADMGLFVGPDYVYDSDNGLFYNKETMKPATINDFNMSDDDFIKNYSKSNDVVMKSIIKWRSGPDYEVTGKQGNYSPVSDKSLLKNVCSLGINYTPHLLYYSKHIYTKAYNSQLCFAIDHILKRTSEDEDSKTKIIDSAAWYSKLNEDINSIPEKVETGDIKNLGLLPLPYIIKDIQDGNDRYIDLLPDLAEYIHNDMFTNYEDKEIDWWIRWSKTYETEINSVSKFIEFAQKYK